jgi:tetratricopeptide (TPR) repeat protein
MANYQLSRIHLTEGEYELAYKEVSQEIKLYPNNFKAYYVRGLIGGYLEKFDQAEKDFRFFIANQQNNPRRWAGYVDLSWVLIRSGQFDQAVGLLDNIDEEFKENPWVLANQGLAYYKKGDYEAAGSILEKAAQEAEKITEEDWLQAYPGNDPSTAKRGPDEIKAAISYNLLLVYDELDDNEKLLKEYENYLSLIPKSDIRRTEIIDQLGL